MIAQMDANIKERWIKALKSGKYKQGRKFLNKEGKFCCIGVLCDLAHKDGVLGKDDCASIVTFDTRAYNPPSAVITWSGISRRDKIYTLMEMNDSTGNTFEEIADYIENTIKGV